MTSEPPSHAPQDSQATPLGIYDRPQHDTITGIEMVAIALSVLWLLIAVVFFVVIPDESRPDFDGLRFLMTMLAIFMPVGMIWVAATAARSNRVMREESARLQAAIDGIRQSYVALQQRAALGADVTVAKKLDEIAAAAKKTETALATFSTRRDRSRPPAPMTAPTGEDVDQGLLALGTPVEVLAPPLPVDDF
ncbi:MAG: hypothetical protein VXW58_09285, partial [Pseudomonadota bacterium]|nr:hypothetical protein [Pseudomonadota bacterium]